MPKRPKPRWNEYGFPDLPEEKPFAFSENALMDLSGLLGIDSVDKKIGLQSKLDEIAQSYLEDLQEAKLRPKKSEVNAALAHILTASKKLDRMLASADFVTVGTLLCAYEQFKPSAHSNVGRVSGYQIYEELRSQLDHFCQALNKYQETEDYRRPGPEKDIALQTLIGKLVTVYEKFTGQKATHTPYRKTEYKSAPQSDAGKFICAFVSHLSVKVQPSRLSTYLENHLKNRS